MSFSVILISRINFTQETFSIMCEKLMLYLYANKQIYKNRRIYLLLAIMSITPIE